MPAIGSTVEGSLPTTYDRDGVVLIRSLFSAAAIDHVRNYLPAENTGIACFHQPSPTPDGREIPIDDAHGGGPCGDASPPADPDRRAMAEQQSMRRVVVSRNSIDLVKAQVPRPGPGEVLVRPVVVGICGSDTHAAHNRHPFIRLPYHPGHEVVGVVEVVGDDVASVAPGQRVTVEPDLPCWTCKPCTTGRENLCENLLFFGCGWEQGGMAAIGMASKGGTVVVVGVPTADVSVPLAIVQDHQIRIQGSATYLPQDYAESISLLRSGMVRADDIVTAVRPVEAVAQAFEDSISGDHVKVLVALDPAAR